MPEDSMTWRALREWADHATDRQMKPMTGETPGMFAARVDAFINAAPPVKGEAMPDFTAEELDEDFTDPPLGRLGSLRNEMARHTEFLCNARERVAMVADHLAGSEAEEPMADQSVRNKPRGVVEQMQQAMEDADRLCSLIHREIDRLEKL